MKTSSASCDWDAMPQGYRFDRDLGPVFDYSPSGSDDLTQICGIETREAVALNHLGIYFFAQIAAWRQREINVIAHELGISPRVIVSERWVEQAQEIHQPLTLGPGPSETHTLPASWIRTLSLLVCAFFLGCLLVYWAGMRASQPMQGVLSADITSLRVPTESRLLAVHVSPGDEVFTNEKLLTIEKTQHLAIITNQEQRVEQLERQLQQAEAQAELDLQWRTRELEEELAEMRVRASLIQEFQRQDAEPLRSAQHGSPTANDGAPFQQVSRSRSQQVPAAAQVNSLLFISGESNTSTINSSPKLIPAPATRLRPTAVSSSGSTPDTGQRVESRSVELRLQQLEDLKVSLPQQVRKAAGVESLRTQHAAEARKLAELNALSRDVAVLSPAYGTVGQVRYREGDTMSSGEIMLKILHTDRRYVQVYVPTTQIADIQPGDSVDLIFPGKQKYRGKVGNVPLLIESQSIADEGLASVRVEPVDKLWPSLPIGSRIDVVIHH